MVLKICKLFFLLVIMIFLLWILTLDLLMLTGAILPPDNGILGVLFTMIIIFYLWVRCVIALSREISILIQVIVSIFPQLKQPNLTSSKIFSMLLILLISLGFSCPVSWYYTSQKNNFDLQIKVRWDMEKMNSTQEIIYEEQSAFTQDINLLKEHGFGKMITEYYTFSIRMEPKKILYYALSQNEQFHSYIGGVFLVPKTEFQLNKNQGEMISKKIICAAKFPGEIRPADPVTKYNVPICSSNTTQVDLDENLMLAINRSQKAYYSQKKTFANSLEQLDIGVPSESPSNIPGVTKFTLSIRTTPTATFTYGKGLGTYPSSYIGSVFVVPDKTNGNSQTLEIVCKHSPQYDNTEANLADPIYKDGKLLCASNDTKLE